jgi:hypothetical protein
MKLELRDFNGADQHFAGPGREAWSVVQGLLDAMPLYLQASGQRERKGSLIFDPKGTNAHLEAAAGMVGWTKRDLPEDLLEFGVAVDSGHGGHIVERQFSNYPFLWNNLVRTQCLYARRCRLPGMAALETAIIVTNVLEMPSSNSTLYYEQAVRQIGTVVSFGMVTVPIRLVGLTVPIRVPFECVVTRYAARTARRVRSRNRVAASARLEGRRFRFELGADQVSKSDRPVRRARVRRAEPGSGSDGRDT